MPGRGYASPLNDCHGCDRCLSDENHARGTFCLRTFISYLLSQSTNPVLNMGFVDHGGGFSGQQGFTPYSNWTKPGWLGVHPIPLNLCASHPIKEGRRRIMLQSELFELLEQTADAAFCVDEQGAICSWNAAARKLFGYSSAEAIGKSCSRLLQSRGVLGAQVCTPEFYAQQTVSDGGTIPNFDLEVTVHSGRRIWVDLSTLIFKDGRTHPRLIVQMARDITERKQKEELLHSMLYISKQIVTMSDGNGIGHPAPVPSLSEQERSILRQFSDGKTSAEIAQVLGITLQTLRNHLHRINEKLGTHSRLQAVMYAVHRKLI